MSIIAPISHMQRPSSAIAHQDRVMRATRAAIELRAESWAIEYRFQQADGSYADVWDCIYILAVVNFPRRGSVLVRRRVLIACGISEGSRLC
jgi:hypothetical protein